MGAAKAAHHDPHQQTHSNLMGKCVSVKISDDRMKLLRWASPASSPPPMAYVPT
jgi:hypothetical protein